MSMPPNLKAKYLSRFDELIADGEKVLGTIVRKQVGGGMVDSFVGGQRYVNPKTVTQLDVDSGMEFSNKVQTLLANVLPGNHPNRKRLDAAFSLNSNEQGLKYSIAWLKATKDDFEHGFLDDLTLKIEAEVSSDYLGQAERLLNEGSSGKYDHVPAAVLAGAVLERGLRTICDKHTPAIPTVNPKGDPFSMTRLIDDIKAAGIFNELRAKQLRAWADIRNAAAHGRIEEFKRSDVETMLAGVTSFLAEML